MNRRKFMLASVGLGVGALSCGSVARNALAIPVKCVNCSTVWQQVKDSAILMKQYAQEVKGWLDIGNLYINEIRETVAIPFDTLSSLQSIYYRANSLVTSAQGLVSYDSSIMQRLRMIESLATRTGNFPDSVARNYEWWEDRAKEQWHDNQVLLGVESARKDASRDLMAATAKLAPFSSNKQIMQYNARVLEVIASDMKGIQTQLQQEFLYDLERRAMEDLKNSELNRFMAAQPNRPEKRW